MRSQISKGSADGASQLRKMNEPYDLEWAGCSHFVCSPFTLELHVLPRHSSIARTLAKC